MCLGVSVAPTFFKQPPFKNFGNFMAKIQKFESIALDKAKQPRKKKMHRQIKESMQFNTLTTSYTMFTFT
jgi:hypothetical protein